MKAIDQLNLSYRDAEEADKAIFAEMRSNLLLIAGEHYNKKGFGEFYDRIRSTRTIPNDTKVRLTKNHIQKIHKIYVNNIVSYAPGVMITPKNESEIQDRKAAELNKSVWEDAKERHSINDKIADWADDFVGCGETYTKIYWDETAGQLIGFEQAVDENGQPMVDEQGQPVSDKNKPKYTGDVLFEEVHPFNILRHRQSKTLRDSPFLCIRKMVQVNDLKKKFPEFADKIQESEDKTFLVFDNVNMGYRKSEKGETLLREFYYRPCVDYPNGYFYFTNDETILSEGELPVLDGKPLFPIECEVFDKIPTEARGRSIIRQVRPYQAELNRCGSKIAEHQMTLGDDKIITQHGAKLSEGAFSPGIRHITSSGGEPTIMAGRSGDQYLGYMQSIIDEMYNVAMIAEDVDAPDGNIDPYALLFKAASQKKVFKRYISRFESYLVRVCKLYLKMCKLYYSDEMAVLVAGKKERVNMAEFRQHDEIGFIIKIEKVSDDIETMMGKQLSMNHLLQYVGTNMDKEDIGKIIKNMPYANMDETFSDMLIDYDNAENEMLALDRGEIPQVLPNDNHEYIATKLSNRMKKADYQFLHDFVKNNYQKQLSSRLDAAEQVRQKLKKDAAGLIPTTGTLIGVDFFVPDPANPGRTKRARLPYDAVKDLVDKLEAQGNGMGGIESMPESLQAQMPGEQNTTSQ